MTHEFEALYTNDTWELVPLTVGNNAILCRWVYEINHQTDRSVERFKDRLVVKGYTKKVWIDYTKTFSPVVKMTTVRNFICLGVKKGWILYQLDVNNAFLLDDLHLGSMHDNARGPYGGQQQLSLHNQKLSMWTKIGQQKVV